MKKGYFALKPVAISEDRKCLTVKFHWLLKGHYSSSVRLCDPPSLDGHNQGPGPVRLFNYEVSIDDHIHGIMAVSDLTIQSRDEVQPTAEDPESFPCLAGKFWRCSSS